MSTDNERAATFKREETLPKVPEHLKLKMIESTRLQDEFWEEVKELIPEMRKIPNLVVNRFTGEFILQSGKTELNALGNRLGKIIEDLERTEEMFYSSKKE